MRRALTLLALSAAVVLADAGTASAQGRSRGTTVISLGFGNTGLGYGQSYYGSGYGGYQSYGNPFGNGYGNPFGSGYGNQFGYPSNGFGQAQFYYSTPISGGQHNGYYGQNNYQHGGGQYQHGGGQYQHGMSGNRGSYHR